MKEVLGLAAMGLFSTAALSTPLDMKAGLQALLESNSASIEQSVELQLDTLIERSLGSDDAIDEGFRELHPQSARSNDGAVTSQLFASSAGF